MFTALVTIATVKMMIETKTWTSWTAVVFFLSLLLWFVFAIVWSAIPLSLGWGNDDIYQVAQYAFRMPVMWFIVMFIVWLCVFPELVFRYIRRMYFPTRLHVIEELERYSELRANFIDDVKQHLAQQALKSNKGDQLKSRQRYGFVLLFVCWIIWFIDLLLL
ncbi:hypothetical protein RFI_13704 [Reticulomyxa filosa]|uniref:P-type ATPase C-terminal domain-containing protein n=1 Tax=Reticulomyxa filosa TaxID=46433 RepID=X6NC57_RETFI|nr:hypothetical protein RFI_13704 [Reticulomyxa filosa]|eukprot:ETO23478.1 hypothetical protein RFI_13704 [Reticulomyxa filosa]